MGGSQPAKGLRRAGARALSWWAGRAVSGAGRDGVRHEAWARVRRRSRGPRWGVATCQEEGSGSEMRCGHVSGGGVCVQPQSHQVGEERGGPREGRSLLTDTGEVWPFPLISAEAGAGSVGGRGPVVAGAWPQFRSSCWGPRGFDRESRVRRGAELAKGKRRGVARAPPLWASWAWLTGGAGPGESGVRGEEGQEPGSSPRPSYREGPLCPRREDRVWKTWPWVHLSFRSLKYR